MDPAVANQNLDPPRERVLSRGLLPALIVNVVVIGALAFGVNWKQWDGLPSLFGASDGTPPELRSEAPDPNDTARMGSAPAPAIPAAASPSLPPVEVVATPEPVPAKPKAPEPRTQVAAVAPPPAEERTGPSFDCSKARSATERLICRDPQLSRMDRELGRVHAQAKRTAPDAADFKRENDEEWRLREAV